MVELDAIARCPICDWPLAADLSRGCVPGNCSYRPDEGSAEYARIKKRRDLIDRGLDPNRPDPEEVRAATDAWVERVYGMIAGSGVTFMHPHSDGERAIEVAIHKSGRPSITERFAELVRLVRASLDLGIENGAPEGGAVSQLAAFVRALPTSVVDREALLEGMPRDQVREARARAPPRRDRPSPRRRQDQQRVEQHRGAPERRASPARAPQARSRAPSPGRAEPADRVCMRVRRAPRPLRR